MLPSPGFHHLHLNSRDPEAAIDFYTRQLASTSKASWHCGWHVTDVRKSLATYQARPEVKLLPLYTTDEGGFVLINSDTWPGTGGVLGLTKAQIAEDKARGVK